MRFTIDNLQEVDIVLYGMYSEVNQFSKLYVNTAETILVHY